MTEPRFFRSAKEFRAWLEKNHATRTEVVVGYHKGAPKVGGFTHKQAVDEALCFGWIDSRAKGGETTWSIRFTPRKPKSIWSAVNLKRIEELKAEGRMHAAGLAAHANRDPKYQQRYSHENRAVALSAPYEKRLRADKAAWGYFSAMPPSYRRVASFWVMSAKKEETRDRRLATLIADSAAGRKIKPLSVPSRPRKKTP